MYPRIYKTPKSKSFFLLGPRGTGKTTFIKERFVDSYYIDLLDEALFQTYLRSPEIFKQQILANSTKEWIVVDEIQRLPALLNYVHQLIETKKIKFILTGSSARKLKKSSANLLAGRAILKKFHTLTAYEIGESFDLKKALLYGLLPMAYLDEDPSEYLKSYIGIYLREEVQQEALVRNLYTFGRFLEAMAFSQAQVVNAQSIASDTGVDRKTIESYIQILEDLLLGFRVPVFQKRAKRKMSTKPKFFYFDTGVYRTLRKLGPLDSSEEIDGAALETLLFQNMKALLENREINAEIFFYRTQSKVEVDFVVYGEDIFTAIEVKRSDRIRSDDLNSLRVFMEDYPKAKVLLLCLEETERVTDDGIRIINFKDALMNLETVIR